MAYSGYLIKILGVGESGPQSYDYTLNMHYILEKTYKMTYSVMDFDSTRNGAGRLIRNALDHKVPHCTIQVKPMVDSVLATLFSEISSRYTIAKEKKLRASVYIPEINDYVTENFYLPDIDLTIRRIENNNKIVYEPFTLEFIGY